MPASNAGAGSPVLGVVDLKDLHDQIFSGATCRNDDEDVGTSFTSLTARQRAGGLRHGGAGGAGRAGRRLTWHPDAPAGTAPALRCRFGGSLPALSLAVAIAVSMTLVESHRNRYRNSQAKLQRRAGSPLLGEVELTVPPVPRRIPRWVSRGLARVPFAVESCTSLTARQRAGRAGRRLTWHPDAIAGAAPPCVVRFGLDL